MFFHLQVVQDFLTIFPLFFSILMAPLGRFFFQRFFSLKSFFFEIAKPPSNHLKKKWSVPYISGFLGKQWY